MSRNFVVVPVLLAAVLALTACDPGSLGGSPSGSPTSTGTPHPSGSPTSTPTPTPTPTPAPDPGPAATPLSSRGAYDRCVALSSSHFYAGRPVTVAPYGSANVIARTDGLWYVYTEATINDRSNPPERDVAFECVLGGTVESPRDELYGVHGRSPLSARDPNQTLPTES